PPRSPRGATTGINGVRGPPSPGRVPPTEGRGALCQGKRKRELPDSPPGEPAGLDEPAGAGEAGTRSSHSVRTGCGSADGAAGALPESRFGGRGSI
ncbi:MAG: hypothetical protein C4346_18780, partial [Chloroflexota bacterium]